jgi:PAS domain S-box-containing protein
MPKPTTPELTAGGLDGTSKNGDANPPRTRGLLPQALEELQSSLEELRVAEEEMRVQNEELARGRLRLEAERQRYQDLFDFAPDGYLVTTQDGTILEANRAASRMLGISTRFLKKRNLGTLIAAPALAEFQPRLRALITAGEGAFPEWVVQMRRRPTGKFAAAVTAARFQGLLGEQPTLRWLIRDISERLEAEEARAALARAEACRAEAEEVQRGTKEILAIVTDIYIAFDTEWRFVSMNASASRVMQESGFDPDSLIGQVLWDAFPTSLGREFEAETVQAVQAGQKVEFETFSKELGRWFQVRVFPAPDGVALYSRDVTERKESEAALRAAYERERRIAETLQEILLHTSRPKSYADLAVETFYEAASKEAAIGGDFSDIFTYNGGKIALVVGDVSGKGLGAATLIAEVKYALRAILREHPWPKIAMARLNDFICEAQQHGDRGSENLLVLSLAVFDPKIGSLSCLTAGGEPLLLLRADGSAEAIGTNGLMLGVQRETVYTVSEAQLDPGDTLLIVTDGLTEARRGSQFFEFESLQAQAVQLLPGETLRDFGQSVIESVRTWADGSFHDDVCLLLARRQG